MTTASDWWLIVGLGNPGLQYEHTRHNAGFMTVDALALRWGLTLKAENRMKADVATGTARFVVDKAEHKPKIVLAKPTTYMNLSGESVRALMTFYKVPLSRVLVLSDDLALPVGRLRLRPHGSDGGHNGLKSIIQQCGGVGFPRLRVGIGAPPAAGSAQVAHVLGGFSTEESSVLAATLNTSVQAIEAFLSLGVEAAMTRYNSWGEAPKVPKKTVVEVAKKGINDETSA